MYSLLVDDSSKHKKVKGLHKGAIAKISQYKDV